MNVIFIGHDLSYVKFYSQIQTAMSKRIKITSSHLYFRPSAWLYAKLVLRLSSFTPCWTRIFRSWEVVPELDDMIDLRFYPKSSAIDQREKFNRLFGSYYNYVLDVISNTKCDLAILPGEYRLFEQAALAALRTLDEPPLILFFEAGPPGYVYFDSTGVNANASFALAGAINQNTTSHLPDFSLISNSRKFSLISHYSLLTVDILWLFMAKFTRGLLDLEEYWTAAHNRLRSHEINKNATESLNLNTGNYIIFIAQVRNDVNHTHFGISDYMLEQHLFELLSDDENFKLIWRDHPLESSDHIFLRISKSFPDRVIRMKGMTLQQALTFAEGVVTVNSNGGLEALAAGLPVRLLGQSYFSKLKGVCDDNEIFSTYRKRIRDLGFDETIKHDAARFLQECFLPINYRDGDFKNAGLAADFILSSMK